MCTLTVALATYRWELRQQLEKERTKRDEVAARVQEASTKENEARARKDTILKENEQVFKCALLGLWIARDRD